MFNTISESEAKAIIDNCTWVLKNDLEKRNDDGESHLLTSMYSGRQSFGCTDYLDHRHDTLQQLKKLVYKHMTSGGHQKLHYFKDRKSAIPYTKIVLQGYHGGYTSYFA